MEFCVEGRRKRSSQSQGRAAPISLVELNRLYCDITHMLGTVHNHSTPRATVPAPYRGARRKRVVYVQGDTNETAREAEDRHLVASIGHARRREGTRLNDLSDLELARLLFSR